MGRENLEKGRCGAPFHLRFFGKVNCPVPPALLVFSGFLGFVPGAVEPWTCCAWSPVIVALGSDPGIDMKGTRFIFWGIGVFLVKNGEILYRPPPS
jgi:hypothetical protein